VIEKSSYIPDLLQLPSKLTEINFYLSLIFNIAMLHVVIQFFREFTNIDFFLIRSITLISAISLAQLVGHCIIYAGVGV
jgi:hypothetical protein